MFDNSCILLSICSSACYIFVSAVVSVGSQTYLPYGGEIFLTAVVFYAFMSKGASPHLSGFVRHITHMTVISCNRSKVAAVRNRRRGAYHGSRSTPRCFVTSSILFAALRGRGRNHSRVFSVMAPAHHRGSVCTVSSLSSSSFHESGEALTILCTCGILICYCR